MTAVMVSKKTFLSLVNLLSVSCWETNDSYFGQSFSLFIAYLDASPSNIVSFGRLKWKATVKALSNKPAWVNNVTLSCADSKGPGTRSGKIHKSKLLPGSTQRYDSSIQNVEASMKFMFKKISHAKEERWPYRSFSPIRQPFWMSLFQNMERSGGIHMRLFVLTAVHITQNNVQLCTKFI